MRPWPFWPRRRHPKRPTSSPADASSVFFSAVAAATAPGLADQILADLKAPACVSQHAWRQHSASPSVD